MNKKKLTIIIFNFIEAINQITIIIINSIKELFIIRSYLRLSSNIKLLIHLLGIILMLYISWIQLALFYTIIIRIIKLLAILIVYREATLTIIRVLYYYKFKKFIWRVTEENCEEVQRALGEKNLHILKIGYYGNVLTLWYEMRKKLLIILRKVRYYAWRLNMIRLFIKVEKIIDIILIRLVIYPIYFFIRYIYLALKKIILWQTYKEIFLSRVYLIFIICIFKGVLPVLQILILVIIIITIGRFIWSFILPNHTNIEYGQLYIRGCELVNFGGILTSIAHLGYRVWSEYDLDIEHGILDYYDIDGRFDLRFLKKLNRFYNQVFHDYGLLVYIRRNVTEEEWAGTLLEERVVVDKAIAELFKLTKLMCGKDKLPLSVVGDVVWSKPDISFRVNPERILNKTENFKPLVSSLELQEAFHKYTYEIYVDILDKAGDKIRHKSYKYFDKQMAEDWDGLINDMSLIVKEDIIPLLITEFNSWNEGHEKT